MARQSAANQSGLDFTPARFDQGGVVISMSKRQSADVHSTLFFDQNRMPESRRVVRPLDAKPRTVRLLEAVLPQLPASGNLTG